MVISEIEYHLVLLSCLQDDFDRKMKKDFTVIFPDLLLEFSGTVKKLSVLADYVYLHFTTSPDSAPSDVVRTLRRLASTRLIRVNDKLIGFNEIFKEDYYMKSGSKPTKKKINDFISIVKSGV